MEVLRERAVQFLEQAVSALEKAFYELVLFNVEQFAQLYVKYLIYRRTGDFPKTHFLRDLVDKLLLVYGDACRLRDFADRWRYVMAILEHAYIASRYLPYRARREDAGDAMEFAKAAHEVFKCLERT